MSSPVAIGVPRTTRIPPKAVIATIMLAVAIAGVFVLAQLSSSSRTVPAVEIAPVSEVQSATSSGCAWTAGGRGPGPDGLQLNCLQGTYEQGLVGPR